MTLEEWSQENIKDRMQNWDLPFQKIGFLSYSDNKKCEHSHPFLPAKRQAPSTELGMYFSALTPIKKWVEIPLQKDMT